MASETLKAFGKNILRQGEALGLNAASLFLNYMFPKEFEAYNIGLELADSEGNSLDYLSFPIMPSELNIEESSSTQIQNSFGGVISMSSDVFVPKPITLSGNFGRNLKIINRDTGSLAPAVYQFGKKNTWERAYSGIETKEVHKQMNSSIKTGYGIIKVLQSILNKSLAVDKNGKQNQLFFYNMAFGESYIVKYNTMHFSQNLQSNQIWNYQLSLTAIAPLDYNKKWFKRLTQQVIQNSVNTALKTTREVLSEIKSPVNI